MLPKVNFLEVWNRFISPPSVIDDEQQRRAHRLYLISLSVIVTTLVYSFIWFFIQAEYTYRLSLAVALLVFYFFILMLVQWQKVRTAAHLMLVGSWGIITLVVVTSGGTLAPLFSAYILIIMGSILFAGWRFAVLYGLLTIIAGLLMTLTTDDNNFFATPMSAWLTHTMVMVLVILYSYMIFHDMRHLLEQARQELEERKSAEGALRESEERFRALVSNSSDVITTLSATGIITFKSLSIQHILGYTPDEMIGKSIFAFIHPEDRPGIKALFQTGVNGNIGTGSAHYRHQHADGSWVHLESRVTNLLDDPTMRCLVVNSRDVTERVEAEQKLIRSESRYRALVENLPGSAVIMFDHELRLLLVDGPELDPTIYTKTQLEGKLIHEALPPDFVAMAEPNMRAVLRGEYLEAEIPFEDKIHCYNYVPLTDKAGNVQNGLIVARNVTALRQSEQRSRQFQEQLKRLHGVSTKLTTIDHLDDLYQRAVELARDELGFDRIAILLFDESHDRIQCTFGIDTEGNIRDERNFSYSAQGDRMANLKHDADRVHLWDDVELFDERQVVGHGSSAAAWMSDGENTIGFIPIDNLLHGQPISENQLELLSLFATTMGHLITRKRAEYARQESEERYRIISEMISDYAFAYDIQLDGTFTSAWITEGSFTRLTGYKWDEIGTSFTLYHPDDAKRAHRDVKRTIAGESTSSEYRILTKSGELRWLQIERRVGWSIKESRLRCFYGVAQDITERKRAEEALRASEERYRVISELASDYAYAYRVHPDHSYTLEWITDDAFTRITGIRRSEFDNAISLYHEDDLPRVQRDLALLLQTGKPHEREYRIITKHGDLRWITMTRKPIWNAQENRVVRFFGSGKDITERKQAQENILALNIELENKATQLATLNEIASDVSSLTDLDNTLRRVLDKLQATISLDVFFVVLLAPDGKSLSYPIMYDAGEFYEQQPDRLNPDGWIGQVLRTGSPMLINRTQDEIEADKGYHNRLGNVDQVSASVLIAPLTLGSDHIGVISIQSYLQEAYNEKHIDLLMGAAYQIAVAVDNARLYEELQRELSTRKRAELEVRQLNAELEQRVTQRTEELAIVNKELEAFAYSISHDLRAPLRSIDGFSRMLIETNADRLDTDGHHYVERVRAASQRIGDMIDALLTLSRVTRYELKWQMINVSAIVQEILEGLAETDPNRQYQFVIEPDLNVGGDQRLLYIMLENLLNNAWKYTARTSQTIITFGEMTQDERRIFFVKDNGAGFDPSFADKLFTVFQRLHSDNEFPGTGVGLATVQRIVRRHGGAIWAEAEVGGGATFYFYLSEQFMIPEMG